jgi:hypothetical protein
MKEIFKQGGFQGLIQLGLCMVMCGALIGVLVSTGTLLILANEGRNKVFLIPAIIIFVICLYMYIENKRECHKKDFISKGDRLWGMITFMLVSVIFSILFTVYIFIPWWIPNYNGGFLLP